MKNERLFIGAAVCFCAVFFGSVVLFLNGKFGSEYTSEARPDQIDLWIGPRPTDLLPPEKPRPGESLFGLVTSEMVYGYKEPKHPRIRFIHGGYSFITPEVEYVNLARFPGQVTGLQSIELILHPPLFGSTHEQARKFTYDLMRQIQAAGWKRLVDVGSPRLKGRSSMLAASSDYYKLPPKLYQFYLDPAYLIPIEEMIREGKNGAWSPSFSWHFYAEGVELVVGLFDTKFDEKNPDFNTYRVEIKFISQESQMSRFFPEADRLRWRELWPAEEKKQLALRKASEALARQYKLEIDETYQDPPIAPPLQPEFADAPSTASSASVPPAIRLAAYPGQPCPQSGRWQAPRLNNRIEKMERGQPMPGETNTATGAVIWYLMAE